MAIRKRYKPDSSHQWRGRSYKEGGKRVRLLRDRAKERSRRREELKNGSLA